MIRAGVAALAFGLCIAVAGNAPAQSATTMTAREMAKQGIEAYDAGRYVDASNIFMQAFEVIKVPTLAVYAARSLEKQGKLVLAAEYYHRASQMAPAPDWQPVQQEMQQVAGQERAALLPRIAKLKIALAGAEASEVQVTIDGAALPSALLRAEQMVDPGTRKLVGKRGTEEVTQEVALSEGQSQTVTLSFGGATAPPPVVPVAAPDPTAQPAQPLTPPPAEPEKRRSGWQGIAGWSALGLGGAGLVLGSVTGLLAMSKKSDLESNGCRSNHKCYEDQQGDIDSYDTMRTLSTVGFVVGAVGVAGGVTLLLTAPKSQSNSVAIFIGPAEARLRGSF